MSDTTIYTCGWLFWLQLLIDVFTQYNTTNAELASPSTGNWALVDVAHNDTRNSSQRLREKSIKIRQALAASVRESSDSSQDRVRVLEQQLQAAERREQDTQRHCEQLLQEKDRELINN